MKTKAISYSDTYVNVAAISRRKWKWRLTKLIILMLVLSSIIFFVLESLLRAKDTAQEPRMHHINPCKHITPEPEVILQEKYGSRDIFFPYSYKERRCITPHKAKRNKEAFQTCFGDEYHCITRFRELTIIRIPYPGNGTYADWKFETDHVAVACECSSTQKSNKE